VHTFKLSRDPAFVPKLRDVVGLYMHPPAHAIVLSVDEKSQIQALERTQPGLPPREGRPATATHDYERHGTTTPFAALNVLDGTVLGRCMQRHRHQEFIRFLNQVEAAVPAGKLVHAILDNYGTHKHPKVMAWLARHPRWTFHFTPTSCSWLNAVETFFAKLTNRRLRRGTFHSLVALQEAINRFVASTTGSRGRSCGPPTRTASSRRSGARTTPWRPRGGRRAERTPEEDDYGGGEGRAAAGGHPGRRRGRVLAPHGARRGRHLRPPQGDPEGGRRARPRAPRRALRRPEG
jgi:transposase